MPELPRVFLHLPIAHRGLHDRAAGIIENSRAAVGAAIMAGYAVEIDVREAACGEAVVYHDEALPRLTGAGGLVADYPATALGRMRLRGSGETIPTLPELLALVAGRAPLLIELKDRTGSLGPEVGALEARVAAHLRAYRGVVAVMSFNPHAVAAFAAAAPEVPRGLTASAFDARDWTLPDYRRAELAALADAERVGAVFVSHDWRDPENPGLARLRRRGLPMLCWTVRSPDEERVARQRFDNVTFEGYRPVLPDA